MPCLAGCAAYRDPFSHAVAEWGALCFMLLANNTRKEQNDTPAPMHAPRSAVSSAPSSWCTCRVARTTYAPARISALASACSAVLMKSACFSFINFANEPASAGTYARRCTLQYRYINCAAGAELDAASAPWWCHAPAGRSGEISSRCGPIRSRCRISRERIGVPAHRHEPGGGGAGGAGDYRVLATPSSATFCPNSTLHFGADTCACC